MSMQKTIIIYALIFTTAILVTGCTSTQPAADSQLAPTSEVTTTPTPTAQTEYELTASADSQTALELLQSHASIDTQDYGEAGQFVTSINGLAADNQHYWAFYVNGEYAEKGVSQTMLQQGDTIKFVYEEITES